MKRLTLQYHNTCVSQLLIVFSLNVPPFPWSKSMHEIRDGQWLGLPSVWAHSIKEPWNPWISGQVLPPATILPCRAKSAKIWLAISLKVQYQVVTNVIDNQPSISSLKAIVVAILDFKPSPTGHRFIMSVRMVIKQLSRNIEVANGTERWNIKHIYQVLNWNEQVMVDARWEMAITPELILLNISWFHNHCYTSLYRAISYRVWYLLTDAWCM